MNISRNDRNEQHPEKKETANKSNEGERIRVTAHFTPLNNPLKEWFQISRQNLSWH